VSRKATVHTPIPDRLPLDLLESLSDLLASILVEEWKAQHSQIVTEFTVGSPRGFDHAESANRLVEHEP
jgi:hypothetical protein